MGVQGSPSVRLLGSMWGMTKGGDQNNAKGPKGQSAKRGFITRDCLRMLPAFALANCGFSCSTNSSSWAPHLRLTWRAFGVLAGPVVSFFFMSGQPAPTCACARGFRVSLLPQKKIFFFWFGKKGRLPFRLPFLFLLFPFASWAWCFFACGSLRRGEWRAVGSHGRDEH